MPRPLDIKEGDIIGPSKLIYIREEEKKRYKNHTVRRATFYDPESNEYFITDIGSVRLGHTKYGPNHRKEVRALNKRAWNIGETKIIEGQPILLIKDSDSDVTPSGYKIHKGYFKNLNTGKEWTSSISHVLSGNSLGLVDSRGNLLITKLLKELELKFIREYSFDDCINPDTNKKLLFDFYLPNYNCCIEYDGEQHFKEWRVGRHERTSLKNVQYRDSIKTQYCKQHDIGLIRIPYTDFNKINKKYVMDKISDVCERK